MSKTQILDTTFENLVETYINARNRAGASILEMSVICLKAKEQLKKKKWFEWLEDNRINLKRTQAKKLIAVAKICKQGGQSTDLLNKKGIEETYLLTKIQDDSTREKLAEQIIEANFTVKQTKQLVSIVQKENITPVEAVKTIKNLKSIPKLSASKSDKKTVPIEEFNKLQTSYEKLLKEKQELENMLKSNTQRIQTPNSQELKETFEDEILKEPVKSELPENTLNKEKKSIVIQGWELPIPSGIKLDTTPLEFIKISAINNAKNKHNLDLT